MEGWAYRGENADTNRKQGLAARCFFTSFFMKVNVVSGLEKVQCKSDHVLLNSHRLVGRLGAVHPKARQSLAALTGAPHPGEMWASLQLTCPLASG